LSRKKTENYQVPSINKAIDIILLLSRRPNLSMKEICSEFQLPFSTCFNILTTLENRDFVRKEPQTNLYNLGYALMRLGLQIYEGIDLRKLVIPYMQDLVSKYGETSYLAAIDYSTYEGVVLEKIQSPKTIIVTRQVGSKFPLYATNTGKSLLAGLTPKQLDEYFKVVKLVPFTNKTVIDESKLREEIQLIQQRGYATTYDEMEEGASGVSAPIKDFQGKVVAAISLAGPTQRMVNHIPQMIDEIKQIGDTISQSLR
jgi:DNA-binding IclR family transcriptional regulator